MQLEHEFVVAASFEETWRFLLDPERVAPCLPGITLDSVGGNVFAGRWKVKAGPVTVTYRGTARLIESDMRTGTLVVEASGKESRGDGTAQATARIRVSAAGVTTRVVVRTELAVTGRAGELERLVIVRTGEKIFERFAVCAGDSIAQARHIGQVRDITRATVGSGADAPEARIEPKPEPEPAQPEPAQPELAQPTPVPLPAPNSFRAAATAGARWPEDGLGLLASPDPGRSGERLAAVGTVVAALALLWRRRAKRRREERISVG